MHSADGGPSMKRRFTYLAAFAAQALVTSPATAGCPETPPPAGSREHAFVQQVIERMPAYLNDLSVPGGAVAVIENGEVILARGFGLADAAAKAPVTERTLF